MEDNGDGNMSPLVFDESSIPTIGCVMEDDDNGNMVMNPFEYTTTTTALSSPLLLPTTNMPSLPLRPPSPVSVTPPPPPSSPSPQRSRSRSLSPSPLPSPSRSAMSALLAGAVRDMEILLPKPAKTAPLGEWGRIGGSSEPLRTAEAILGDLMADVAAGVELKQTMTICILDKIMWDLRSAYAAADDNYTQLVKERTRRRLFLESDTARRVARSKRNRAYQKRYNATHPRNREYYEAHPEHRHPERRRNPKRNKKSS